MRLEIFTAIKINKTVIFCVMEPCGFIGSHQSCRETCSSHLHGRNDFNPEIGGGNFLQNVDDHKKKLHGIITQMTTLSPYRYIKKDKCDKFHLMRFQVPIMANIKIMVFCDVMPCSLVDAYRQPAVSI
jgi:hypothetical protein